MVKVMFIEGKYKGDVILDKKTLDYLKRRKKVALYTSVQFLGSLGKIKQQLVENNIAAVTSKPNRTQCAGQLLGCDCYADSLNLKEDVGCFLYVGDGKFHPLALAYGQEKEVVCFDPLSRKMKIIDRKMIEFVNKKRKGALLKFLYSSNIGVIVTIKQGQEQLKPAFELEKKYLKKKFYYFVDNNISFDQLENFPFIDIWVNTACPRIGIDDCGMFRKGVVNLNEISSNWMLTEAGIRRQDRNI